MVRLGRYKGRQTSPSGRAQADTTLGLQTSFAQGSATWLASRMQLGMAEYKGSQACRLSSATNYTAAGFPVASSTHGSVAASHPTHAYRVACSFARIRLSPTAAVCARMAPASCTQAGRHG